MWRMWLAIAVTVLIATSVVVGWAAKLTVDGGTLQVFTYPVELEPVQATISKELIAVADADGDGAVEVGERVEFTLRIAVKNVSTDQTLTDVVVSDAFGAELEIVDTVPSLGTASISTIGGSDKPFLTWDIGTLDPGEEATLTVVAATDINPGGQQEYSEAGAYELNSGATLKALVNGKQISATSDAIWVEVVEANPGELEDTNPTPCSTPTTGSTGEYEVQPGETLIDIATRFGTTLEALVRLNRLQNANLIFYDSTLNVPCVGDDAQSGAAPSAPLGPSTEYEVQPGDSLSGIAARFGTTVEALTQLNGVEDPSLISYGSTLNVPYVGEHAGDASAGVSR